MTNRARRAHRDPKPAAPALSLAEQVEQEKRARANHWAAKLNELTAAIEADGCVLHIERVERWAGPQALGAHITIGVLARDKS